MYYTNAVNGQMENKEGKTNVWQTTARQPSAFRRSCAHSIGLRWRCSFRDHVHHSRTPDVECRCYRYSCYAMGSNGGWWCDAQQLQYTRAVEMRTSETGVWPYRLGDSQWQWNQELNGHCVSTKYSFDLVPNLQTEKICGLLEVLDRRWISTKCLVTRKYRYEMWTSSESQSS